MPGVPRSPEAAQQESWKKEDPAKMLQPWALALPLAFLGGRWSREGSQVSVWLTTGPGQELPHPSTVGPFFLSPAPLGTHGQVYLCALRRSSKRMSGWVRLRTPSGGLRRTSLALLHPTWLHPRAEGPTVRADSEGCRHPPLGWRACLWVAVFRACTVLCFPLIGRGPTDGQWLFCCGRRGNHEDDPW